MLTNRPRLFGTLVGLVVTFACAAFFFSTAGDQRLELQAFDERVRLCNTLGPDAPIVHVDIDDGALERVGHWPWPRADIADLIRSLDELGAGHIIVDLLFSEHESPYFDDPALGSDADVEPAISVVGQVSRQNLVYGDLELADAVRSAGNVIMAVQLDIRAPDEPDSIPRRIRRSHDAGGRLTVNQVVSTFDLPDTTAERAKVNRELLRLQLRDALLRQFTLSAEQLAARLGVGVSRVQSVVAGVKRHVAEELVDRQFSADRRPDATNVLAGILGLGTERRNADRKDVLDAYRRRLGLSAFARLLHRLGPDIAPRLYRAVDAVPLYYAIAQAAKDIAAVNFVTDRDGSVRRVPLVINDQGRAIPHLGLAAAARILNLDLDQITMPDSRTLLIPHVDTSDTLRLPLDGRGNLIIHWTRTAKNWRRGEDFPHISAAKLWSLVDARRQVRRNQTMIDYLLADVVAASKGNVAVLAGKDAEQGARTVHADNPYRRKANEQLALQQRIHLARLRRDLPSARIEALQQQSGKLLADIRREQTLAVSAVRMFCHQLEQIPADEIEKDADLKKQQRRFKAAQKLIQEAIPELRQANQRLEADIARLKTRLAAEIKDRYVFLGFAATAEGDIVATPIDSSTNGVMCHAQVLNSILQNRFIAQSPRWLDLAVFFLFGAIASAVTATRGPKVALVSTLVLIGAYIGLNSLVIFRRYDIWMPLVPVVITVFLTWAFVTLFRQLTAERDKRLFRKQLSQYTSPAIAAKIAESPDAARAFKQVQTRHMTCFFSDLAGFTSITEREDAEVVQYVLNTYLERMCQVIWSTHGLVSKFMGDGVMAFFNSSVDPLPQHPRIACETALQTFEALERLKQEQAHHPAGHVFQQLKMRVGIAAGNCKNGDLGSELKADYTIIGDVVNLAARLEPANKVFGTQIMISGPVHDEIKDGYECRYLAELQVKGKTRTVPAYEVVGRKGRISEQRRACIEDFEAGVELYQARRWDDCIEHFTEMLSRNPKDLGATCYIHACREFKRFPPANDWNRALELKVK